MKAFKTFIKWTVIYAAAFILFFTIILFFMTILGCDKSSQKKQFVKPAGMSWEVFVYLSCLETSPDSRSGLLKKETTHNPLECKNLESGVLNRNKFDLSKDVYKYCADEKTRLKTHSWQECYNILK